MLSAYSDFEVRLGRTTFLDAKSHQLSDTFLIQCLEWVVWQNLLVLIFVNNGVYIVS